MKKFKARIEGVSPILFNRFTTGADLEPTKKKVIITKSAKVEDKMYLLPNGKPYIPARYFEAALIDAGKDFKGKGKGNLSKILGAMLEVKPDTIPLISKKGWQDDMQVAVNPMTRGRMVVHRPRFDDWTAEFDIEISTDDIPKERISEIMEHAGRFVGIGDWRPAKKGKYGKFIISEFKEV